MDLRKTTFVFSEDINDTSVGNFMKELIPWCQKKENKEADLQIILNSGGGGVLSGLAFYGFIGDIRRAGHRVTIKVLGRAGSAAAIVLQAADHRIIAGNSEVLVHAVRPISLPQGSTMVQLQDELDRCQALTCRTMNILTERSNGLLNMRTIKKNTGNFARDWWLKGPDAQRLGVVDEIQSVPPFAPATQDLV
ncbi:MAG: hypothetical protein GC193_14935 [Cryomorphaceae bacterium]|nr:hypothetical protein [Cryomorphaceae bacterium]